MRNLPKGVLWCCGFDHGIVFDGLIVCEGEFSSCLFVGLGKTYSLLHPAASPRIITFQWPWAKVSGATGMRMPWSGASNWSERGSTSTYIYIYIYVPTGSLKTVGQNDIRLFFFTYTGETTLCRASGAEL